MTDSFGLDFSGRINIGGGRCRRFTHRMRRHVLAVGRDISDDVFPPCPDIKLTPPGSASPDRILPLAAAALASCMCGGDADDDRSSMLQELTQAGP